MNINFEGLNLNKLPNRVVLYEERDVNHLSLIDFNASKIINEFCNYYLNKNFSVIYFFYERIDFELHLCSLISKIEKTGVPIIIMIPTYDYRICEGFPCRNCPGKTNFTICFYNEKDNLKYVVNEKIERKIFLINIHDNSFDNLRNILKSNFSVSDIENELNSSFFIFSAILPNLFQREQRYYEFNMLNNFLENYNNLNRFYFFIGRFMGWKVFYDISYTNLKHEKNLFFRLLKVSGNYPDRFHYLLTDFKERFYGDRNPITEIYFDFLTIYRDKFYNRNSYPELKSLIDLLQEHSPGFNEIQRLIEELKFNSNTLNKNSKKKRGRGKI